MIFHINNICLNWHILNYLYNLAARTLTPAGTCLALALTAAPALADSEVAQNSEEFQEKTSGKKQPPSDQQKPVSLEPLIIIGDDRTSVLPTSRAINSVFGNEQSVLDTPRSVSVVSKKMLALREFQDFTQLERVAAGVFTPRFFGTASLPVIRAQQGEIFQNGQRKQGGNGGFGFPISFNSLESMDIVKGPPSAVFGPGQRVGGYVNINTKRAYLDKFRAEVSGTVGSYDTYRWGLDVGAPLIDNELGFRLSYQGEDSDSFYRFAETESHAVYAALDWHPNDRLGFDFNVEHFDTDFSDIGGINRPTQDLIDNLRIITGTGPATSTPPGFQTGQGTVVTPTGTAKISRRNVFIGPDDLNEHDTTLLQLKSAYQVNDHFNIINYTTFQTLDKATVDTNSFVEIIDENYTVQNRTELHHSFDFSVPGFLGNLNIGNDTISGIAYKFHHTRGFSNFNFEDDNSFDLTLDPSTRVFAEANLTGVLPVPGFADPIPQFSHAFASPAGNYPELGLSGNGDTNATDFHQIGLFYQHTFHFTEQWSLLAGGRGDLIYAKTRDPLAPEGFKAVSDSATHIMPAANVSLTYKPVSWNTLFFTYSYSQSPASALGGGFALKNNRLAPGDFHIESELYETGTKFSLLDDRLYFGLAFFRQTRGQNNVFSGNIDRIEVEGIELESSFQPNRNFFANANVTLTDAQFKNTEVFQGSRVVADVFDNSRPDIIQGGGLGSRAGGGFGFPADNFEMTGQPDFIFSGTAAYTFDAGFGASLSGVLTSPQNLDVLGTVVIPWQHQLDASVFYDDHEHFEARVAFLNITNEKNWRTQFGSFFGSETVSPDLPFNVLATIKLRY